MTVFVVADLHLGDDRLCARARTQFATLREMEEVIAYRWNAVVQPKDVIYVLGDVGHLGSLAILRELSGEKHLVAGNCDRLAGLIASHLFRSVTVAKWLPGALLTHIPVHASQLRGATINVHGHLHSARIDDPRYRCVSVEQTDYWPIPLSSLTMSGWSTSLL
ncbi:metallophosphoesterase family protein [Qipengyuania seohaensis]|uniref:metallophosphoesterase family protein n=1 Tax=Qipengyuania seohaensis TaxID=266951 RepID=UPI000C224690|nr:metallophosphoesterase family protein [Qipengyuania seohaensis]